MTQWVSLSDPPEVMPLNDVREHIEGPSCWCAPTDDDGVLVHHAADERERYETGARKAH